MPSAPRCRTSRRSTRRAATSRCFSVPPKRSSPAARSTPRGPLRRRCWKKIRRTAPPAHCCGASDNPSIRGRMAEAATTRRRKRDVISSLGQPKVAVMLALGFSSGLPFLLTGNTLGYWLRDEGTTLKAIGFLSWVGLAYSVKFLWAPVVDRVNAPLFGRFGRRRSWMLLAQVLVGVGLLGLSISGTQHGLTTVGALAV